MSARSDKTVGVGEIELLQSPELPMTSDAILKDFTHYFGRMLGRRTIRTKSPFLYQAVVYAARDRLMERWGRTRLAMERDDSRRVSYLSLEFLMGRLLRNALLNLGIEKETSEALNRLGLELEDVYDRELDAGLGNGGLGRLAACFLDSCATLALPVVGYGIRYRYGMFHQRIDNGYQVEEPDPWLRAGFPWEVERYEFRQTIKFGGRTSTYKDTRGRTRFEWTDTHDVLAIPYDVPVPGYRNDVVNTLRLWSAAATDEFDLEEFNAGGYTDAVAEKNLAENITMVLYRACRTCSGITPTITAMTSGISPKRTVSSSTTRIRQSPLPNSCAFSSTNSSSIGTRPGPLRASPWRTRTTRCCPKPSRSGRCRCSAACCHGC
jgi:starch phosphorylase